MSETLTLDNGVNIVLKDIPNANSISIGVFTVTGLMQEPEDCSGIAHFLEHMSFKGTRRRTAKEITEEVDHMGGVMNAHTTKEYTCYYISVLPHCYQKGMDILFDLFLDSQLEDSDIVTEKQIVGEEINMYLDTPDEYIHDLFSETIWKNSFLGRPILGTLSSLESIDRSKLKLFKEHYLNGKNMIVAISGKIEDKDQLLSSIQSYLSAISTQEESSYHHFIESPKSHSTVSILSKDTEQIHFCLGAPGVSFSHPDHYKLTLLGTLLGGSMSSRLFQNIREKHGWAYSIYAYSSFYLNSGLFTIYAGINRDKFHDTLTLISEELDNLVNTPITAIELARIKEQLKGNLILSLERSSSWMNWLGRSMLYFERLNTVDDIVSKIEAVTIDDIQSVAQQLFSVDTMALSAIGPFTGVESEWNQQSFQAVSEHLKLLLS